jgi:hypothetical protein
MTTQALKDKDLQEYYDALFAMYGTPGWTKLMEDTDYMIRQHDSPRDLNTAEQLHFRKGELAQMDWLLSHQQRSEAAYSLALQEQGEEVDAEEVESGGAAKVIETDPT